LGVQLLWALCVLVIAAGPDRPMDRLQTAASLKDALHPAGRPVLVHFWALWCKACVEELPRQVALARSLEKQGVDALFVDLDGFAKADSVKRRLQELAGWEVARQTMLSTELDVDTVTPLLSSHWNGLLPATFAVMPDGKVAAEVIGPLTTEGERRLRSAFSGANDAGRR
jgi:thiol-disulfide isomerase/thioredoxin